MKKRAWIYCRVAENNTGFDLLEMQRRSLERFAKEKDYEIVGTSMETASAFQGEDVRGGLQEIITKAKQKKYDVLLVKSFDRISRSMGETERIYLKLGGIKIISPLMGEYKSFYTTVNSATKDKISKKDSDAEL